MPRKQITDMFGQSPKKLQLQLVVQVDYESTISPVFFPSVPTTLTMIILVLTHAHTRTHTRTRAHAHAHTLKHAYTHLTAINKS